MDEIKKELDRTVHKIQNDLPGTIPIMIYGPTNGKTLSYLSVNIFLKIQKYY